MKNAMVRPLVQAFHIGGHTINLVVHINGFSKSKETNLKVVKMQDVGISDKANPDLRLTVLRITVKCTKQTLSITEI